MLPFVKSAPKSGHAAALDVVLLVAASAALVLGLGDAALWDPLELELAERALHPAPNDAAGAAVHATYRLFGESAAGARLLPALATIFGMVALWAAVACLESRSTARVVPFVFVTTPSLFVHARTVLPDALATGAIATAFAGLAVAALDPGSTPRSGRPAAPLALGVIGLAAGWVFAGPLLGAAVPAGSIAVALACASQNRTRFHVVLGVVLAGICALAIARGLPTGPAHATPFATATAVLHGAFPWSALLPLALANVRDRPFANAAWAFAAALLGATTWLGSHAPHVVDVGPLAIALLAALALTPARPTTTFAALGASGVLAVLLALDFDRLPEKAATAWGDRLPALATRDSGSFFVAAGLVAGAALAACALRNGRRALALGAGVLAGALVLRARFYPAAAKAAGPGEAFAAWNEHRRGAEPLGALGVSAGTLRFAHVGAVVTHADAPRAHAWLDAPDERRFLVAPRSELATLNALFRAGHGTNLPVVGDATPAVLLFSNRPDPGTSAKSPLDAFVRSDVPTGVTESHARFGDALELAGWEVVDERGRPRALSTGAEAHLRLYWRVLRAPVGHCTFLHVDRSPARFAAEHGAFEEYPTALWRAGDVIVDDYAVRLPLAFRGAVAPAYVGVGVLPCSDDRRMPVTAGPSDGHDRVLVGRLAVQ